ncbi:MAG: FixH family protein [Vicinamibacterales bacterium]
MRILHLVSEYRWPIYIGGHLTMSVVACGVLVWVATRPDVPRPIEGYYQSAQSWDVDEAVEAASRDLGWTVHYDLPADVPHYPGMPRPIDVTVADRDGHPVAGLAGALLAIRPSDGRLNQRGDLVAVPTASGSYRTLVRLDQPGAWELRLDARQGSMRFVHAARITVAADTPSRPGVGP